MADLLLALLYAWCRDHYFKTSLSTKGADRHWEVITDYLFWYRKDVEKKDWSSQ